MRNLWKYKYYKYEVEIFDPKEKKWIKNYRFYTKDIGILYNNERRKNFKLIRKPLKIYRMKEYWNNFNKWLQECGDAAAWAMRQ